MFFQLDSKGVAGAVMRWGGVGSQGGWQCLGSAENRPSLPLPAPGMAVLPPCVCPPQFAGASLPQPECSSWPLLLAHRPCIYLEQMLLASPPTVHSNSNLNLNSPNLSFLLISHVLILSKSTEFCAKSKVTEDISPLRFSICQTPQCSGYSPWSTMYRWPVWYEILGRCVC